MKKEENSIRLGFNWIKRKICNEIGYQIVIIIDNIAEILYSELLYKLSKIGLEYLEISKDIEYQKLFKLENGIAIYVKKHNDFDTDFSNEFNKGFTVLETYNKICELYSFNIAENSYFKLLEFKEIISKNIDWESAKIAMPELEDFDILLCELSKKVH